jgi:mono/diheme cytochrome c family protein
MPGSARKWLLVVLGLGLPLLVGADGGVLAERQCAGCHALAAPPTQAPDLGARRDRQAPPLYYAGNKFRRDWLVHWLQQPQRIRPAGMFPYAHTRPTPDGDVIDQDSLPAHPAVSTADAELLADFLMTLKPHAGLISAETWQPGTVVLRMGRMNFGKFKGCDGCHQDGPGYGGVSGPELYTAWQRLQPEFIASYIADPLAWDPLSVMPRTALKSTEVHKLADYLKALAEAQP